MKSFTSLVTLLYIDIAIISYGSIMCPVDTDVFKTSSGRLTTKPDIVEKSGKRRLIYDILKTSYLRRLEDVQFTRSWRRLICDVLRISDLRCLEDVQFMSSWKRPIYDVLRTSNLRRRQDVWLTTSWGRPIYIIFKTSKEMIFPYFVLSEIFRNS